MHKGARRDDRRAPANFSPMWRQFSIVAPDSITSSAQIGDCSTMKRAKSSGEPGCVSALNFMKFTLAPGVLRPSLMAALSLLTIAAGVRGGASTPDQAFCGNVG